MKASVIGRWLKGSVLPRMQFTTVRRDRRSIDTPSCSQVEEGNDFLFLGMTVVSFVQGVGNLNNCEMFVKDSQ